MKRIAAAIITNSSDQILAYLRDDNPDIPYPNHWDLFGGHVEDGETYEQALVREIEEEIGVHIDEYSFWREYNCVADAFPNIKRVYHVKLDIPAEDLVLSEGQRLAWLSAEEARNLKWANILGKIVCEFMDTGL